MRQHLNYNWKFVRGFKEEYLKSLPKEAREVNIPHNAVDVPYNYFDENDYQDLFTYKKVFDVEESIIDRVSLLSFDGFMLKAKIYLNDVYLGEYISGYVRVTIDVSKVIKQKGNVLIVVLDSHEDKDIPPFGLVVDYLTFSGIYREVYIDVLPTSYLKDIFVFGNDKGELKISHELVGSKEGASVEYELLFEGKSVAKFNTPEYVLKDAKLWDIDNPNLYTLKTTLNSPTGVSTYLTRFGFRTSIVKNDGLYLNGKKIKLRGLNRHQSYPIMGYAASKSLQEDDANILKNEIGVNVVRTSHYPQSDHFLNRCDELGLLVINEIPGWQHIGKSKAWRENCINNLIHMVKEERNHPSIILYGVRIDESIDDDELYEKTNRLARELDPYRQTIGVRNVQNSHCLEDVYGYNDFVNWKRDSEGVQNPKKTKTEGHPLLITEYLGHMDPTKPTSDFLDLKDHCLRHLRVINDSNKYDNLVGAIGWCFADYNTHRDFGSGDRICPHGILDIYRNKKFAYAAYASQQDKYPVMEVINNMKPGDYVAAIFDDVYVVTNVDYVKLYKEGEYVGTFCPNHKDKRFANLAHPPILIDDIIGETFKEEKFAKKDWARIAATFSKAGIHGLNGLSLKDKLFVGRMMMKYKLSFNELLEYWIKYIGTWGGYAKTYRFDGYKDDKLVISREVGPQTKFDLEVTMNKNELVNEETYDTLRVSLRYIDEHKSTCNYATKIVHVETTGPISIIGEKSQSLLGGQLSLYFTSNGTKGKAKISISLEGIHKEIEINVR